jgi:hypothetical protein
MKLVKNFALAVLLAFVFAVSAPAGEIGMPGVTAQPSPTPHGATSSDESKSAFYGDPDAVISAETSDYLLFEALAALLSVY